MNDTKTSPEQRWNAQRQSQPSNQLLMRRVLSFPSYLRAFDIFREDISWKLGWESLRRSQAFTRQLSAVSASVAIA